MEGPSTVIAPDQNSASGLENVVTSSALVAQQPKVQTDAAALSEPNVGLFYPFLFGPYLHYLIFSHQTPEPNTMTPLESESSERELPGIDFVSAITVFLLMNLLVLNAIRSTLPLDCRSQSRGRFIVARYSKGDCEHSRGQDLSKGSPVRHPYTYSGAFMFYINLNHLWLYIA